MSTGLNAPRIDLISDTSTRPTPEMREAMARAEVGDEARREDPSVNELCERVAALLGKEDALFLPSGTMCNQIALAVHCRPGDEILAASDSHILTSEGGGAAVFAGAMIRELLAPRGIFDRATLLAGLRPAGKARAPRSRLLALEQTHNRGGGSVWPLAQMREVTDAAREHSLAVHIDGARLMNAVVASSTAASDFGRCADSLWLDFSKGLGCPVGGVLAGSKAFVDQAWEWKYRFGGAMRQAGILAGAALHALDHHVERLADDHRRARAFADGLERIPRIVIDPASVETNLVFFEVEPDLRGGGGVPDAPALRDALLARGVRVGVESKTRLRAVFHLDIDDTQVDVALAAVAIACAD